MDIDNNFIKKTIINWYDSNARNLPWRKKSNNISNIPYRVLISEIMLQQTTVGTVKNRYIEFMKQWPNIKKLSQTSERQILTFWSGLGYYKRAINLYKCAKIIKKNFNYKIPNNKEELMSLPGIGDYTSSAILAIAYNQPVMAVDANIKRIITRIYGLKFPIKNLNKKIEQYANKLIHKNRPGDMIQSLMDFGSIICKPRNPSCKECIINNNCIAYKKNIIDKIYLKNKLSSKNKPILYTYAYLIINNNKILLRRRHSKGMLPMMIEVPTSKWLKKPLNKDQVIAHSPIKINYKKLKKKINYQFSHFILNISILVGNSKRKKIKKSKWYDLKKINKIELPTVMKKIIDSDFDRNLLN